MAMIAAVGGVFLMLGLASGIMLVAAPLTAAPASPSDVIWALFPILTLTGYLLLGMAARLPTAQLVSRIAGGALLVLSLVAAIGLLLISSRTAPTPPSLTALWYVLSIGLMVGLAGISLPVFRRPTS
jgi:hypothetical protein